MLCRCQYNLQHLIDPNVTLLPYSIHVLGSAHEKSNVWTGPYTMAVLKDVPISSAEHINLNNNIIRYQKIIAMKLRNLSHSDSSVLSDFVTYITSKMSFQMQLYCLPKIEKLRRSRELPFYVRRVWGLCLWWKYNDAQLRLLAFHK